MTFRCCALQSRCLVAGNASFRAARSQLVLVPLLAVGAAVFRRASLVAPNGARFRRRFNLIDQSVRLASRKRMLAQTIARIKLESSPLSEIQSRLT